MESLRRVFPLLLLFGVLIPCSISIQSTVSDPPQNTVVERRGNAKFSCTIEPADPEKEYIYWGRERSTVEEAIVRTWDSDVPTDPNKYDFTETAPFVTNIVVKNVMWDDVAMYKCQPLLATENARKAQLVVVEKPSISVPDQLSDGKEAILGCEFTYAGRKSDMEEAGLKPSMTAKIGDQKLDLNITETDADPTKIMASDVNVTMTSKYHGENFTCIITIQTTPPYETSTSQTLNIQFKVSNVKVNTVKEVYYPGEQINCTAEGNPSPQFTWKPQGAPDRDEVSGPVLTVTREMLGENQWICVARNVIDGKEITNETPVIAFKVLEPPIGESRNNDVAIAVGVVVPIVVIALVVLAVLLFMRKKKSKQQDDPRDTKPTFAAPSPPKDPPPEDSGFPEKPDASVPNDGFVGDSWGNFDEADLAKRTLTPPPTDGRPYSPEPYPGPPMTAPSPVPEADVELDEEPAPIETFPARAGTVSFDLPDDSVGPKPRYENVTGKAAGTEV